MTTPTLTWTSTAERTIAVASTSSVIAELLTAIKAAIDNDSTLWQTSDYSSGNGTLELKRKGSPTGEQSTVRILFFGGSSPNSAALLTGLTAGATTLYVGLSVDANTTGPSTAYTAGAPYSSKYTKGVRVSSGGFLTGASSPRISLIECEDALAVCMHDTSASATAIVGRVVEEAATTTLMWACFTCGAASFTNQTTPTICLNTDSQVTSPLTALYTGAVEPRGVLWNATLASARVIGRSNGFIHGSTNPIAGSSGNPGVMVPVMLSEGAQVTTPVGSFFAFLRQIRMGPIAKHLDTMRSSGVTQGIHFGPPYNATGYGAWFDQSP